jgi:hypothetical protein
VAGSAAEGEAARARCYGRRGCAAFPSSLWPLRVCGGVAEQQAGVMGKKKRKRKCIYFLWGGKGGFGVVQSLESVKRRKFILEDRRRALRAACERLEKAIAAAPVVGAAVVHGPGRGEKAKTRDEDDVASGLVLCFSLLT